MLSDTTVSYLFAAQWAPPSTGGHALRVPGATVDGLETGGTLLNLALWSLKGQGLIEIAHLRPVDVERTPPLGGESFTRMTIRRRTARRPGLEGALLAAAVGEPEHETRHLILALDLHGMSPWSTVAGHCLAEARAAGLAEERGRLIKTPVITDEAAVSALAPRDAEIAEARKAYRARHEERDNAVLADCLHALNWAHNTGSD